MTVFCVDDDRVIAETLAIIFRQQGFDAHAFYDGESALVSARSVMPHLLVTDYAMPGLTGYETAAAIRALHPNCVVICVSGHLGLQDEERFRTRGPGWLLLSKPVRPSDLLEIASARCQEHGHYAQA